MPCNFTLDEETEALVALSAVPGLGSIKIRLLVQHYGCARAALNAEAQELNDLPGFNRNIIRAMPLVLKSCEWQRNIDLAIAEGAQIISYKDPRYPKKLLDLPDYPVILYVRGALAPQDSQGIAVI